MTAKAGKGSGATGGKPGKKTSAASKPQSDEVTLRAGATNGSEPSEEDRTTDKGFAEDTLQDIEVAGKPESKGTEPSTDNTGSWAPARPALAAPKEEDAGSGNFGSSSGRSSAMDVPTSDPGFGGSNLPDGDRPRPQGSATLDSGSKVSKLTNALRKPTTTGSRKPPRKAHLQVARLEPWSVMKFSFVMSLVCFLVLFVAVAVLYVMLSWLGVFDALSNTIRDLTSNDQGKSGGIDPASWFSAARILSYTALIGTLNVLLITALATVWSVIYNMAADLVGGVEVTLKEADQ